MQIKYLRSDIIKINIFDFNRRVKETKNIILDSTFEKRSKTVWSLKEKSTFIESILIQLPLQPFYFYQDKTGNEYILDGKLRLDTILEFLNNEFELTRLELLPEINGKRFKDLSPLFQNNIEDTVLELYTILPPVSREQLYMLFKLLNKKDEN